MPVTGRTFYFGVLCAHWHQFIEFVLAVRAAIFVDRHRCLFPFVHLLYESFDFFGVQSAGLTVDDLPPTVQQNEGRDAPDAELGTGSATNGGEYVQPDDAGLRAKLAFQPVHDRLDQEAGRSGIGVELDQHGFATVHDGL